MNNSIKLTEKQKRQQIFQKAIENHNPLNKWQMFTLWHWNFTNLKKLDVFYDMIKCGYNVKFAFEEVVDRYKQSI
jgi:hypothetical protein